MATLTLGGVAGSGPIPAASPGPDDLPVTSAAVAPAGSVPDIRVRVRRGVSSAAVSGRGMLVELPGGAGAIATDAARLEPDPSGALRVVWEGSAGAPLEPGSVVRFACAPGEDLRLDGVPYPGVLEAIALPPRDGAPRADIANTLDLETYLAGVVSAELYQGWPQDAFCAQAVCARSYALFERQRRRARGAWFDLDDSPADQVYAGRTSLPAAVRAVESTRGVVLTDAGRILRAYYSSTCGGRAARADDAWPDERADDARPLDSCERLCPCDASPVHRWEVERSRGELSRRWRAWGASRNHALARIGTVRAVEAAAWNPAGRPVEYRIEDRAGAVVVLPAEFLRIASNFAAPGLPTLARDQRLPSGDAEFSFRGERVVIRGRGMGHGVGLCQFGARALADRGESWRGILAAFFPGAELQRAY